MSEDNENHSDIITKQGLIVCAIIVVVCVMLIVVAAFEAMPPDHIEYNPVTDFGSEVYSPTTESESTPNLYELTRQTAENTRHIFWLIVVCFAAWSFRSYKTGK